MREPDRALDLSRDGLATGALAARLSPDPSVGQRPGAFQTSQKTLGRNGGTPFGDRSMALGDWTDDGSKPGFGLLGEHPLFSLGRSESRGAPHKGSELKLENDKTSFEINLWQQRSAFVGRAWHAKAVTEMKPPVAVPLLLIADIIGSADQMPTDRSLNRVTKPLAFRTANVAQAKEEIALLASRENTT